MGIQRLARTLLAFSLSLSGLLMASTGPDDRPLTDPKSVTSASNLAARPEPIDDLYYTRSVFGPAWSPDGQQIVFTSDISGRPNLWKVRASGGWPIQLVQSDERQYSAVWSHDGKWIVYQQDHAGDELWDLYAVPSEGGDVINLTNTPAIREQDPHWYTMAAPSPSPTSPRKARNMISPCPTGAVVKCISSPMSSNPGYSWNVVAWSSDDRIIYADRVNPPFTDADVYRIDVATGKLENLTSHQGTIRYLASSLSPDGQALLLSADAKGNYMNVALLNIASKKVTWVTDLKWKAFSGNLSSDGKSYTYVVNEDGLRPAGAHDGPRNAASTILPPTRIPWAWNRPSAPPKP